MKIKLIRGLLVLLCLLPATIGAQTLNRYEYWFDDNYAGRKAGTLSGTDKVISKAIPTAGLDYGVHRFNLRVRRSDNMYSAVTSQLFLKLDRGTSNTVEYWFDDNIDNRSTIPLPAFDEDCDLTLDLADAVNFPLGFHKLNMRVTTAGGGLSAVSTSDVLKLAGGVATQLEYWFDDDIAHSQRLDGSLASTGDAYIYNTNLDLTALPVGLHRLNYRAVCPDSDLKSAVMTQKVMKLPSGKIQYMEYWVDGNIASRKRVSPNSTSTNTDIVFNRIADLGSTNAGAHRLYMRGVSADRKLSTAITSMPVMVKSLYNEELIGNNPTMNAFSISVDNEKPVLVNVSQKKDDLILNPYTLDARNLSVGDHTLKAHFWNSANAGIALEQTFKVNALETPTVQLTAEEKNGQVTLKFNSVPNDLRWRVVRTDANGARAKIDGKSQGQYPSTVSTVDAPPPGQFTYMVRTVYTDANGTEQAVNSNEVTVNVAATATEQFAKIIGQIRVGENILWGERWKVTFSDGFTTESDGYGRYRRDKVPVGSVFDITVQARDYQSETQTVNVNHDGEILVNHQGIFDEEGVRSRYTHDLQFDSNVEFEPRLHMKFKVKNITRLSWHGKLRIVTGRKEYVDNPPKNPLETGEWLSGDAQALEGSVAPFVVNDYLQYDYSDPVLIPAGETVEVRINHHIPITSPPLSHDELYYFFVESVDEYGTKLVAINDDYNIKENPLVQLVDCGVDASAEDDIEMCVNLIMGMCSGLPELDGKLGDMSKCMDEMQETLGYALAYDDLAGVIERSGSYIYIRDAIPEWKFYRILYNEDRRFLGMVNAVRDKISDAVRLSKNALQYTKKAKACLDAVKSYNQWQDMTDLERAGSIADKILSMSESTFPFAKILKTYLDVTKASVRNILNLGNKWDSNHDYMTFRDDDILFDIKVKKNTWITTTFDAENVKDQILYAEVKAIAETYTGGDIECTSTYEPTVADGKVRLHRVSANGPQPEAGAVLPIKDMWMTVWWANGRVSTVPIRNSSKMEGNGVKYESNHYTVTFQSETCKKDYMADIIHLDD